MDELRGRVAVITGGGGVLGSAIAANVLDRGELGRAPEEVLGRVRTVRRR